MLPLQQPVQDVWSHTQVPSRHRCPLAQAAPDPHWQTPPDEQLSEIWLSHGAQAVPGAPQERSERVSHVLPLQQPCGHDVASQTHCPACEQCRPGEHESPAPHLQDPSDPQLFDTVGSHAKQVDPALPHMVTDRGSHAAPLQHPLGHEVPSHTHCPPTQRCPGAHAVCPPHVHWPAVHPSAVASQATQAPPPDPQVVAEAASHVLPEQQPLGHTQPLHAPAVHVSPCGHAAQACPALPHAAASCPVMQVSPLQQPLAHDAVLHTHLPPTHCCPPAHAAPDPHSHSPFASHPSLVCPEQPLQMHAPSAQARPGGHPGPLPHAAPSCPSE